LLRIPTEKQYQLLRQPTRPAVSTTMEILSLCAASARPPGVTTHQKYMNSTGMATGNRTCLQRHLLITLPINDNKNLSTTYYKISTGKQYQLLQQPTRPSVSSTMEILNPYAASVHPPGLTTHHKYTDSNSTATGNRTCFQRHCWLTQAIHNNKIHSTTYYKNAIPLSQYTPSSPMTSLHAISALPTMTITHYPIILMCISIATFFTSRPRMRQNSKRTYNQKSTKRHRTNYPMDKPPGTRSKFEKCNTVWNIVYDPSKDKVLIWQDNRVRIYRRRGHRQFVYLKGKSHNTFPRTSRPIKGQWQGSYFIVDHMAHWQNQPTRNENHIKIVSITTNEKLSQRQRSTQGQHKLSRTNYKQNYKQNYKWNYTQNDKYNDKQNIKQNYTWNYKTHHTKNTTSQMTDSTTPKVSQMRIPSWPHQKRPLNTWTSPFGKILKWTKTHLDAYLATAEILLEQNIDPG
jgi:hypothetical protein